MRDPNLPVYQPSSILALRLQLAEVSLQANRNTSSSSSSSTTASSRPKKSPSQTMATLQNLSKTSTVVLFTPVLTPSTSSSTKKSTSSSTSSSLSPSIDPFETLGRSLASHHPRIRHVPYIPSVGFTSTHSAFLHEASAIIIVLCEASHNKSTSLGQQLSFAEAALSATTCSGGDILPPILVQCGSGFGEVEGRIIREFEIVIKCAWLGEDVAKGIAGKMFGRK
ncbi:uncharacterized protein RCC_04660 [Ramularia collo-cygni]|uniref:Uncharacterized protein n=1 Tax=Ramularia collo-cygni TaxID=112498 RepID=A0A2D3V5J4_9PEZI|nr:uncharacterized protein RCC_04660 [Ramularia collo-cygni]CZT18816.1 uncharacterized protein RCC_04660 [Ramularia collo-cygni]